MGNYFVSCNPGLEKVLLQELSEVCPYFIDQDGRSTSSRPEIIKVEVGGIELSWDYHLAIQLNFFLKTAHRVLYRFAHKNVYQFLHLESWLSQLEPQKITGSNKFKYQVSCLKSKLGQEKRVRESLINVLGPEHEEGDLLMLRIFEDRAELSLDTSGDHLHFRGYRKQQGAAPLRESLAAALVYQLTRHYTLNEISNLILLDPFCGAGTILTEAYRLFEPELIRTYAFQNWQITPKLFKLEGLRNNYRSYSNINWKQLIGIDVDAKVLEAARANCELAEISQVSFFHLDSSSQIVSLPDSKELVIISNPPYEKRVENLSTKTIKDTIEFILNSYKPKLAGFLLPQSWDFNFSGFEKTTPLKFKNGGLAVHFCVYKLKDMKI